MSYEDLVDPSNPFNRTGLSREVRSILGYVQAARRATGFDIVCTSTTDHPRFSASGNLSRHLMEGTDGLGLAVDLRMRTRSSAVDAHDKVFDIFVPVERRLRELIYAYGPIGRRDDGTTGIYNIRTGKRVAPYATSDHRDHCHISLVKGVFLEYPGHLVVPPPPPPSTITWTPVRFMEEDAMRSKVTCSLTGGKGYVDIPGKTPDQILAYVAYGPDPADSGWDNVHLHFPEVAEADPTTRTARIVVEADQPVSGAVLLGVTVAP